jgi:RecB family exonuclease
MKNVTAWSFSRLKDFEQCPLKAYMKYVEKRSDDHMDRSAANRGTMVHDACEKFVRGEGNFIKEMAKFRDYFGIVLEEYNNGNVLLEEDWGFDSDWQVTGWFDENVWCRMKLDNLRIRVRNEEDSSPEVATATDYKTGKKYGNEVSHGQQGQLYAIGTFLRFPSLDVVDVELIYLDQGQTTKRTYTREKAMRLLPSWTSRGMRMTDATDYPPKPNKMTCMWCPFGPQNGDGSCDWGV